MPIDYSLFADPKPGPKTKKNKPPKVKIKKTEKQKRKVTGDKTQKQRTGAEKRAYTKTCDLIWIERGGKCELCGRPLVREYAEFHHIKLRSQGGKDTKANLAIACGGFLAATCAGGGHNKEHGINVVESHPMWSNTRGRVTGAEIIDR
jgi:5-methylcytosine-specific restriction endonuclease McrA